MNRFHNFAFNTSNFASWLHFQIACCPLFFFGHNDVVLGVWQCLLGSVPRFSSRMDDRKHYSGLDFLEVLCIFYLFGYFRIHHLCYFEIFFFIVKFGSSQEKKKEWILYLPPNFWFNSAKWLKLLKLLGFSLKKYLYESNLKIWITLFFTTMLHINKTILKKC